MTNVLTTVGHTGKDRARKITFESRPSTTNFDGLSFPKP